MSKEAEKAETDNKALIEKAFNDWEAGTGGVFDLLADDAEWTIVGNSPVSRTFTSRAEFMDVVINPFNSRMSTPLVREVHALCAEGDTVIAYFDARATAKDGNPYFNSYTWYLTLEHGKVVKAIAFFDTIEFTDFWNRVSPDT